MKHQIKITEAQTLKAIKNFLEVTGWEVWRINNAGIWNQKSQAYYFHGDKGVPDLVAFRKDTILFLECKSPTGKASLEQLHFLELIESVHFVKGAIVRSIDDVMRLIK